MTANVNEWRCALLSAQGAATENAFSKVSDAISDELLDYDDFPEAIWQLLLDIYSQPDYYAKLGSWVILPMIGLALKSFPYRYSETLSQVLAENYENYDDADLRFAACDFFARYCQPDCARKMLRKVRSLECDPGHVDDFLRFVDKYDI